MARCMAAAVVVAVAAGRRRPGIVPAGRLWGAHAHAHVHALALGERRAAPPRRRPSWRVCGSVRGATTASVAAEKNAEGGEASEGWGTWSARVGVPGPTGIQSQAYPAVKRAAGGRGDCLICGETGSGKTLAYLVPIMECLLAAGPPAAEGEEVEWLSSGEGGQKKSVDPKGRPLAVIVCPTRELVAQVTREAERAAEGSWVSVIGVVGEQPVRYADVVVATPPALRANWGKSLVRNVRWVVLDEADMLLSGDAAKIMEEGVLRLARASERHWNAKLTRQAKARGLPVARFKREAHERAAQAKDQDGVGVPLESKSFLFVGATLPSSGRRTPGAWIAHNFPGAERVESGRFQAAASGPNVTRRLVPIGCVEERPQAVLRVLEEWAEEAGEDEQALVFVNSGKAAEEAAGWLEGRLPEGLGVAAYHAKLTHPQRRKVLARFQGATNDDSVANMINAGAMGSWSDRREEEEEVEETRVRVLVCTDGLSRGVDFPGVTHVVQAEFAQNATEYLHRAGRTGRAGRPGRVTSVVIEGGKEGVLVDAIFGAADAGQRLDLEPRDEGGDAKIAHAFSRNRNLRNKVRRSSGRKN